MNKKYTFETSYSCYSTWHIADEIFVDGKKVPQSLPNRPLEEAVEMWIKWDKLYVQWKDKIGIESFELTEDICSEIDTQRPEKLHVYSGTHKDYIDNDVIYIEEGKFG
jgi:hypothetical protein